MDEKSERKKLQAQCIRLGKCFAAVRMMPLPPKSSTDNGLTAEERIYFTRRALQAGQALVFSSFASMLQEKFLTLIRSPERAEEIGRDGLDMLYAFLEEFTDLVEQEYQWS